MLLIKEKSAKGKRQKRSRSRNGKTRHEFSPSPRGKEKKGIAKL